MTRAVPACPLTTDRVLTDIVPSGDGVIVLFQDWRTPQGLYGQRLVDTVRQWGPDGKLILINP